MPSTAIFYLAGAPYMLRAEKASLYEKKSVTLRLSQFRKPFWNDVAVVAAPWLCASCIHVTGFRKRIVLYDSSSDQLTLLSPRLQRLRSLKGVFPRGPENRYVAFNVTSNASHIHILATRVSAEEACYTNILVSVGIATWQRGEQRGLGLEPPLLTTAVSARSPGSPPILLDMVAYGRKIIGVQKCRDHYSLVAFHYTFPTNSPLVAFHREAPLIRECILNCSRDVLKLAVSGMQLFMILFAKAHSRIYIVDDDLGIRAIATPTLQRLESSQSQVISDKDMLYCAETGRLLYDLRDLNLMNPFLSTPPHGVERDRVSKQPMMSSES